MTPVMNYVLPFVTIWFLFFGGFGSASHLEVVPPRINELITEEVNITCRMDDSPFSTQEVVLIEVGRQGRHPLVTVNKKNLKYGPSMKSNMMGEGHVDSNATLSYARLTIKNPSAEDAGVYVCLLFYQDGFGELKGEKKYANVTVDNDDDEEVFTYLVAKVRHQETQIKEQQDLIEKLYAKDTKSSAFMALREDKHRVSSNTAIVFGHVQMRLGDGYDQETGVFTAPYDGLYVFHLLIKTTVKNHQLYVGIEVNNETVSKSEDRAKDFGAEASLSSVVNLKTGDTVKCVLYQYTTLDPYPYSWFAGYLVKAM